MNGIHIVSLQASNVKRLSAVTIVPNEGAGTITIGGPNGAGKSSILDAIEMALAGRRSIPPEPINAEAVAQGRASGEPAKMTIVARLSNGLVIKRTKRDGGADALTVTNEDGAVYRSPQAMLDALYGSLTFDPIAFMRMAPREKRAQLMALSGLNFEQLDSDKAALSSALTAKRREAEQHRAASRTHLSSISAPDQAAFAERAEERSASDVAAALNAMQAANRERTAAGAEADRAAQVVMTIDRDIERIAERVEKLRRELEAAERELQSQKMSREAAKRTADLALERAEAMPYHTPEDCAAKLEDIQEVERHNASLRRWQAARASSQAAEASEAEAKEIADAIAAIEAQREQALRSAAYPVPGLGVTESGVTYNGHPIEQASTAEQIRVSVAMGLATNPSLRVMLVKEGAALDDRSLALLDALAREADAQVWVERVGDDGKCSIVIEDGALAIDRTAHGAAGAEEPGDAEAAPQ